MIHFKSLGITLTGNEPKAELDALAAKYPEVKRALEKRAARTPEKKAAKSEK